MVTLNFIEYGTNAVLEKWTDLEFFDPDLETYFLNDGEYDIIDVERLDDNEFEIIVAKVA